MGTAVVLHSMPEVCGMSATNRWLTPPETARVLEVSEITVRAWMDAGVLKGINYTGEGRSMRRIYAWSIRAFLEKAGNAERGLERLDRELAESWDGDERREKKRARRAKHGT